MDETEKKDYETEIVVKGLKCLRCGWEWMPRKSGVLPRTCPNSSCHSSYWNRPRTRPVKPKVPKVETFNSEVHDLNSTYNK